MVAPICAGFWNNYTPKADMSVMMPLMFGMLGIGGMRSYDKMKKTDTKMILKTRRKNLYLKLHNLFMVIANYFFEKALQPRKEVFIMKLTPKQKKLPKGLQEAILKSQKKVKRKRKEKK